MPLIVILAVGVFLNLPDHEESLAISANDLSLSVGDSKNIVYSVNIQQASVNFKIENDNIAQISNSVVHGLCEGETRLTITATYRNAIAQKSVSVKVLDDEGETEEKCNISVVVNFEKVDYINLTTDSEIVFSVECSSPYEISHSKELSLKESQTLVGTYLLTCNIEGTFEINIQTASASKIVKVFVKEH